MEQRLSMLTLGSDDVPRARAFYEKLGWRAADAPGDVVFFQLPGLILGLWERAKLAEDSGLPLSDGGAGGVSTPAILFASTEEVDTVLAEAEAAGARIARPGAPTFWGGYSGVFVDPDGHAWEIAHNPHWTIGTDGSTTL
jgi:catechol 2,3-dioxygenase-like lactoylglutathione lyase family enzyme